MSYMKIERLRRLYVSEASVPLPFPPFSRDLAAALVSALRTKRNSGYIVQASTLTASSDSRAVQGNGNIRRAAHAALQETAATLYALPSREPLWILDVSPPDCLHLRLQTLQLLAVILGQLLARNFWNECRPRQQLRSEIDSAR